jgi:hypothetical protein
VSVTWYDSVAITVEVAFAAGPLDTYILDEFGEPILDEDDLPIEIEWSDISAYVLEIPNIASGAQSEFSPISPSTMSVVLSNGDRRFDPEHVTGPHYGKLLPGKKIRVSVVYSAVTYYLFTGYVQGWPQEYQSVVDSTVTIDCVDGSRFLEQAVLARSAYEAAVLADSPVAYWPMQESSVLRYEDTQTSAALTPLVAEFVQFTPTLPIGAPTMARSDPASIGTGVGSQLSANLPDQGFDEVTCVEMWMNYRSLFTSTSLLGARTRDDNDSVMLLDDELGNLKIRYSNIGDNRYCDTVTTVQLSRDNLYHLAVRATSTTIYVYINGAEVYSLALTIGTSTFTLSDGATAYVSSIVVGGTGTGVSHFAVYTTAPAAARIAEHYVAGVTAYGHPFGERSGERIDRVLDEIEWPAADRDISVGDTVHGRYLPNRQSAMKYMRDVETAEDGYLFLDGQGRAVLRSRNWQWTQNVSVAFSDTPSGAELDYTDIEIDANSIAAIRTSVSASYDPDGYLFSEDIAARRAYGPARESLSTPTIDTAAQARALTVYKLRAMKDPRTRITGLTHTPRILNATAWPKILGLRIGARVTVERHPQAVGTAIVKTLVVRGIEHRIDPVWWETRLYLSPAPDTYIDGPYLLTNDATYGKTGAVAGNKVSF